MPPFLLMRSTAICTPTSAVLPTAAAPPDSGWTLPTLYGVEAAKPKRSGTGAEIAAAPPTAAQRSSLRRVGSLPANWVASSAIVVPFPDRRGFCRTAAQSATSVAPSGRHALLPRRQMGRKHGNCQVGQPVGERSSKGAV